MYILNSRPNPLKGQCGDQLTEMKAHCNYIRSPFSSLSSENLVCGKNMNSSIHKYCRDLDFM